MSLNIDDSAVKRINELRTLQGKDSLMLRVRVDGGGCSGFQYNLELTEERKDQDIEFADSILTDDISMGFLKGATVFFEDGLIGSEFKINNPNATSGCGCGTSFSVM
ncbi:MAG: iron-sulfur cluster assembly accessory protein [Alphaproteobacteria bacterium]|nr:MAG: iron-sulfur cluster assembly accessory protein [Alphaproteobacteria bacterium]